MTTDKARKRAVRTRMTKTGESYTAARRQVVGEHGAPHQPVPSGSPAPHDEPPPPQSDLGAAPAPGTSPPSAVTAPTLPVSDAATRQATGRGWDDWLRILDERGIEGFSHRDTAAWLVAEHGIGGWWSQTVTVGFERARGLRLVNETTAGFSVGVSRTVDLPIEGLYRAVVGESERDRWLSSGTLRLRTATPHKSARFDFRDGASRVVVGFTARDARKSTISIQHERLSGTEDVEAMRSFWRMALAPLAASAKEDRG